MELGFPCSHCKQKYYIQDVGLNWAKLYKKYLKYHEEHHDMIVENDEMTSATTQSGSTTNRRLRKSGDVLAYGTWFQYVRSVFSHLKFQK